VRTSWLGVQKKKKRKMSKRPSFGSVLMKSGIAGAVLVGVYKLFVPSEEKMAAFYTEKYGDQTDDLRQLKELSAKGYSYQAITKIIAKEKKEKIHEMKQREAEERALRGEPEMEPESSLRKDGRLKGYISGSRETGLPTQSNIPQPIN